MSSYLMFRKKGLRICEFSRSNEIYKVFDQAPYDKWTPVSVDTLKQGIHDLQEEIDEKEAEIAVYKDMMKGNLSYEDLYHVVTTIHDYQEEIIDLEYSIMYVRILIDIEEYSDDDEESHLEWSVG